MILARTPLRLTLGGGGSDLPVFSTQRTGFTLTVTIDKYVHVAATDYFPGGVNLKYAEVEHVTHVGEIRHRLWRAILSRVWAGSVELTSMADIPSGTGLGSSAAFTVSALAALHEWRGDPPTSATRLAAEAALIEMVDLGDPIGTQDQYACAVGGLLACHHHPSGIVVPYPIPVTLDTWEALDQNLHLFWTGMSHDTRQVLAIPPPVDALQAAYELGTDTFLALTSGDLHGFAESLTAQWANKLSYAPTDRHVEIGRWIYEVLERGAQGAKLVGAGDGGFILVYAEEPRNTLEKWAAEYGLREVPFRLVDRGTELV